MDIHRRYLPENHTPEVAALHQRSQELNLHEFWSEREDIEQVKIKRAGTPYRWAWNDIHAHLNRAAEVIEMEDGDAERRAIIMVNPGLEGRRATTNTLFAAFSCYNPGERSAAHRHTPNASRFGVMGEGGYTTVQGEKCTLNRGDLVLTPAGCWHDHGNDSKTDRIIWMDVLDIPLILSLNTAFFDLDYSEVVDKSNSGDPLTKGYQTPRFATDFSKKVYGAGGVFARQVLHGERVLSGHSPMYKYHWDRTQEVLETMKERDGDPFFGIAIDYRNPLDNGAVLATMSFSILMLRPGEKTLPRRDTTSNVFFVMQGRGRSVIEGETIEWGENDVIAQPNWSWTSHENLGDEPVILYTVSDEPTIRKLSQFRQQGRLPSGEIVDLAAGQPGTLTI